MSVDIKDKIKAEMKSCMLAREKEKLSVVRQILAEINSYEIDNFKRGESTDEDVLMVLSKMLKQRTESATIYDQESRQDLADKERYEMSVIKLFMPEPLSEEEVEAAIIDAVSSTSAAGLKDMGKVMAVLRGKLQGRADLKAVSEKVRKKLT